MTVSFHSLAPRFEAQRRFHARLDCDSALACASVLATFAERVNAYADAILALELAGVFS